MNKPTTLILFCLSILICSNTTILSAQNLVPNPNFDSYSVCPENSGQLAFAFPWFSPNGRTTDFAHECASGIIAGIPINHWGDQVPAAGRGYAGIRTWLPSVNFFGRMYREYIAAELISPLEAGKTYYLSFKVSPGENAKYVSDDIAMALVDTVALNEHLLTYDAALSNPEGNILSDFNSWKRISGQYIAKGGEKFVVIGNFKDDANTSLSIHNNGSIDSLFSSTYLYIDEVSVEVCKIQFPDHIILTEDTALCPDQSLVLKADDSLPYEKLTWDNGSVQTERIISSPGIYTLTMTAGVCQKTDTIFIDSLPHPSVHLGADTSLCPGERLILRNKDQRGNFSWNDGSRDSILVVSEAGVYSLNSTIGNCSDTDDIQVSYAQVPALPLAYDSTICMGQSVELNGAIGENATYLWSNMETTPVIQVNEAGKYTIQIQTQCFLQEIDFDISTQKCDCNHFIPNVFTPNQDGIHDQWKIKFSEGIEKIDLQIFTRWGQSVFHSTQSNYYWSGKIGKKPAPEGVYFWVLRYTCIEGTEFVQKVEKGYVSLLR